MYTLHLLGTVALEGPEGLLMGYPAQPRQLALLALLSAAGPVGCTRDRLGACLWPEAGEHSAHHSLADALYRLRHGLGAGTIQVAGVTLALNPALVRSDVHRFLRSLGAGDHESAVAAYGGPFLEGFHLNGSAEFERWREAEGRRFATLFEQTLEDLAERATIAGDARLAARWWARASAHDPLNSRFALGLAESLAAAGSAGNALRSLEEHAEVLRDELDMEAPRQVVRLMHELRAGRHPVWRSHHLTTRARGRGVDCS